ncbi:MAG: FkbM family methyltransferase [Verrucomicrobia bacterium]|nr:FkbM family methyltransferase [Verrucomicrobiota bacterium]
MNDTLYRSCLGLVIRLVSLPGLSPLLGFGLRVLGRHHRLFTHLRAWRFDGVIDGGANVGEFAQMVRRALPAADLVCVEPHPACAERLRRAGFRTVEAALWDRPARLSLVQPNAASTSSTCLEVSGANHGRWEVEACRLADLELRGERLLLKMDLQGAELTALAGMSEEMWARTAGVLLEMRVAPGTDRADIEALLRGRGFYDYATLNEILVADRIEEVDKLWLREGLKLP